jgi:carbonic anhydrase
MMAVTEEFLIANREFAASFNQGGLPLPPKRRVAVVVCMDARIDPAKVLGLEIGDAHVIRNAGGRADDALRSLVISQQLLGTEEGVIIHHTDRGMLTFTKDDLRSQCFESLGDPAGNVPESIDFLPFPNLEQSVRDDLRTIRESPLIPATIPVRGFVYDVENGLLSEVA